MALPADSSSEVAVKCHDPENKYQLILCLKIGLLVQSFLYPKRKVKDQYSPQNVR